MVSERTAERIRSVQRNATPDVRFNKAEVAELFPGATYAADYGPRRQEVIDQFRAEQAKVQKFIANSPFFRPEFVPASQPEPTPVFSPTGSIQESSNGHVPQPFIRRPAAAVRRALATA